jgi:hypothetical protein
MNTLTKLATWYQSHCDGDWEDIYGIKIDTLDNSGWSVDISLQETELEDKDYEQIKIERSQEDWLRCSVKDGQFQIRCSPLNLEEGLNTFLTWADSESS